MGTCSEYRTPLRKRSRSRSSSHSVRRKGCGLQRSCTYVPHAQETGRGGETMSAYTRVGTQAQSERKVAERKERRKRKGIQRRQNKGKTVQDGEVTTTPLINDAQAHRHLDRHEKTHKRLHAHALTHYGKREKQNEQKQKIQVSTTGRVVSVQLERRRGGTEVRVRITRARRKRRADPALRESMAGEGETRKEIKKKARKEEEREQKATTPKKTLFINGCAPVQGDSQQAEGGSTAHHPHQISVRAVRKTNAGNPLVFGRGAWVSAPVLSEMRRSTKRSVRRGREAEKRYLRTHTRGTRHTCSLHAILSPPHLHLLPHFLRPDAALRACVGAAFLAIAARI